LGEKSSDLNEEEGGGKMGRPLSSWCNLQGGGLSLVATWPNTHQGDPNP